MMTEELKGKCELIATNYLICKKAAKLDMSQAASLAALLFTYANKTANEQDIRRNRSLLKKKVGMLSSMRGFTQLALIVKMCLADDSEKYLDKVIKAYEALKSEKSLYRSEYTVMAAQVIASMAKIDEIDSLARDSYKILSEMKKDHPFITTSADTTLAALFAMSKIDYKALLNESENCYNYLKDSGFKLNKNTLQSVCFILALSPKTSEEKCERFKDLRQALKDAKHPIKYQELAILAALCDIEISNEDIVREIIEADEFLKHKKGFGIFGAGKQLRRMYASALVLDTHSKQFVDSVSANSVIHVTHVVVEGVILALVMAVITTSVINSVAASASAGS